MTREAAGAEARNAVPPGLGCWEFSDIGSGSPDDEGPIGIIREAARLGIRHLDTAQDYGSGHSERVIARAVAGRAEDYFIASERQKEKSNEGKGSSGP